MTCLESRQAVLDARDGALMPQAKIAWIFPKIMGTNTLFTNLEQSAPAEVKQRSLWLGLSFGPPAPFLQRLPLPDSVRLSLDLLRQTRSALREHPEVNAL